ncbi:MAG TPA: MFS transporter [Aestuariivirgaceae bacterium]|nr:MFS transporter [Aestuariivirgaceae bacterium]
MKSSLRINPWIVVWLCFGTLAIVMSARQSVAIMTDEWVRSLGWSKTFIGSGQSVALIVMAIFSPVAGNLADRFGARNMLVAGLLVISLGLFTFAVLPAAGIFVLAYGIVGGLGFATANMHLISTALAKLFKENRGLATGIANSGATAGQFLTVPLLALSLTYFSWRWSMAAMGIVCSIMAVVIWVMLKQRHSETVEKSETLSAEPLWGRLKFLITNPTFHILYWSFFICGVTTTGAIETHFLPYAAYCGFPPVPASGIYGLTAAINFGAMFLSGYLTDRVNRPLLLGSIYLVRSLSFIVLMNVGTSYEMMFLFAVIYGIFDYSTVPPTASLVASHLGLRIMGLAMGLISGGHALGGALGAWAGGYLFDLFARYNEMWWLAFGTAVIAGFLVFMLRENRRQTLAGAVA